MVTEVEYDEEGVVLSCVLEAVLSRNEYPIDWQELKDADKWLQGWKFRLLSVCVTASYLFRFSTPDQ